ncbi:MAG TPA: hypothetical protein VK277_15715 [Acidimicrobiales bacterium]|nr:hypothetical protein [Acidimicrobiales bacterium]
MQPIDDHFLLKYRQLLDAEDAAFDDLEHACEEGNRPQFDEDLNVWQATLTKRLTFLKQAGMELPVSLSS